MSDIEPTKTMDENYENLKCLITALTQDYEKFNERKIKAAGQRVRNGLLNIKKLCDELRKQVKSEIVSIPIKHRTKSGTAKPPAKPPAETTTDVGAKPEEANAGSAKPPEEAPTDVGAKPEEAPEKPKSPVRRRRRANKVKD
jgi:hypothetical protein